jgi:hypothetical protein
MTADLRAIPHWRRVEAVPARAWQPLWNRFEWSHARTRGLRSSGLGRGLARRCGCVLRARVASAHPLDRGQRGCPGRGDRPGADRAPRLGCSGDGGYYASRRLRREHSGLGSPGVADRTSRTSGDAGLRGDLPSGHPHLLRRWSASLSVVGVRFDRDYLHREMSRLLAISAWPGYARICCAEPTG